jgi:hypothetical protein
LILDESFAELDPDSLRLPARGAGARTEPDRDRPRVSRRTALGRGRPPGHPVGQYFLGHSRLPCVATLSFSQATNFVLPLGRRLP